MNDGFRQASHQIQSSVERLFCTKFKELVSKNKDFTPEKLLAISLKNDFDEEKTAQAILKLTVNYIKNETFK